MTYMNFVLPYTNQNNADSYNFSYNYQSSGSYNDSYFSGSNYGSSNATALASANGSGATAFASAGSNGLGGVMNSFQDLAGATGNNNQMQSFMDVMQVMQFMQMFMNFFQQMMQALQNMFGGQNSNNSYGNNNNTNANANANANSTALANANGNNATAYANANSPSQAAGLYNNTSSSNATAYANASSGSSALLDKVDEAERKAVEGQDLSAVDSKGNPVYLVAKGKKDDKYHIYKQCKDGKGDRYKCVSKVKSGNNYLYVNDPEKNKEAAAKAQNSGISSALAFAYDPSSGSMSMAYAQASGSSGILENQSDYRTGSPLILDTNKDGKVSAEQGKGVDVNGDGKADGAATGGDKMLAMGDIDGDGQITGKEVFGNETVDPFTGEKLNAANGFDALNQVAKSAEKHTGIDCINDNGEVDLQKLKQALEQSGKGSLGMISGDNTTQLEGLGDAAKISTHGYINQQQTGDVQHNQLGQYTDANGQIHQIHDVWFNLA